MKFTIKLKERAILLKKQLNVVYYAYRNPKINFLPKIIIAIAIAYALSPIDLIPDFIPVLGYLDDLIIIPALIVLTINLIPEEIMAEARKEAENQPLRLNKNWTFAIIFILIWGLLVFLIVTSLVKFFKNK